MGSGPNDGPKRFCGPKSRDGPAEWVGFLERKIIKKWVGVMVIGPKMAWAAQKK
jgi:hypothetical protein